MPWNRVLTISDPLLCRTAFEGGDVEILPTAKGSFQADITQVGFNRLRMSRYNISVPQVSAATLDPGRTMINFLTEPSSARYCGTKMTIGDIIINKSDAVHQVADSNLSVGAMSLPIDELITATEAVIGHDLSNELVVRPSPALMSRLLKLHQSAGQLARDVADILDLPEVCRALEEQLVHVMVRCLAEGASVETTRGSQRHEAVMTRFEAYLEAHPDQPLYLTEICAALGVAERTLRAYCEEHLGMGPIRFLTLRRMHLVRRALLHAEPSTVTVTRIATDHGFWELGRFSVAYRALFGEPPSKTLGRPANRTAISLNRPSSLVSAV
ncbi:helix-turn-helix domain-containing protein [Bradyrhizobium sp. Tv2a-2]|uniref:helix-turn-helix domain-containing protein n=1 Tax=Bradyrhizobium sp. Tv2a-2 TaxID=113395 RepID=UPI000467028C|nr:helix-turn-helix domain-containing protein [Bradyrhizobium sp. Tv2a-2]